jgi:hypothetical protein
MTIKGVMVVCGRQKRARNHKRLRHKLAHRSNYSPKRQRPVGTSWEELEADDD